jgi:hypothetical protein
VKRAALKEGGGSCNGGGDGSRALAHRRPQAKNGLPPDPTSRFVCANLILSMMAAAIIFSNLLSVGRVSPVHIFSVAIHEGQRRLPRMIQSRGRKATAAMSGWWSRGNRCWACKLLPEGVIMEPTGKLTPHSQQEKWMHNIPSGQKVQFTELWQMSWLLPNVISTVGL